MSLPSNLDRRISRPLQPLPGGMGLVRARVHEFCGPARVALAAMVMELSQGAVLWILPAWLPERLFADGLCELANPARLILARARRPEDILWSMEEALRSGGVPLVVAELPSPPALTPVRRLNLAAEAGAEAAHHWGRLPPLGLMLTPGDGGAQGAESRWNMTYAPSGSTLLERHQAWQLRRTRARADPPASWRIRRDEEGRMDVTPLPGPDGMPSS